MLAKLSKLSVSVLDKPFLYFFYLVLLLSFLASFYMLDYCDPFAYHLVGPRFWFETSLLEMMNELTVFLTAGLFDYMYIIPTAIFYPNTFLIQIFSQNMHFVFSLGLGSIILLRHFGLNAFGALAALAILTISRSQTFFIAAKNDGPLALAVMITAMLVIEKDFFPRILSKKRVILIGIMLGVIPAIKLNGLFFIAPIALYYVWLNRKMPSNFVIAGTISSLILGIVLFKNWYFIGNPVFPAMTKIFPGTASKPMIDYFTAYMSSSFEWSYLVEHMKIIFSGKILHVIAPFLAIYQLFVKKDKPNVYFYFGVVSFILYQIANGGVIYERFVFASYFLFTLFVFKSLKQYKWNIWGFIVLFLLIVIDSKIDRLVYRTTWMVKNYSTHTSSEIIKKVDPLNNFWAFMNKDLLQKERVYILTDEFSNVYHGPKSIRTESYPNHPKASVLKECKDISKMKRYSFAILMHEKMHESNKCYELIQSKGVFLAEIQGFRLWDISMIEY